MVQGMAVLMASLIINLKLGFSHVVMFLQPHVATPGKVWEVKD